MFTVTITKTTIEEKPAGKDWLVVETDEKGCGTYGYTPEIVKKREVELKIYEQTVDEIDIVNVIEAVNKPGECFVKRWTREELEELKKIENGNMKRFEELYKKLKAQPNMHKAEV